MSASETKLPLTAAQRAICYYETEQLSPLSGTVYHEVCRYPAHLHGSGGHIHDHSFVPWEGSAFQKRVGDRRDGRDPKHNRRSTDSAEQSQGVTDEMVMTAMRAFGSVYGDLNPEYASDDQRLAFRRALEAVNASQPSQDAPTGKNVLETVEKYRREHPGALERAEAEMIAEEAGVYDYTCPHCLKVFKAIYGQDFPHCPYCAKQLTWWPEASQRTQQAQGLTPFVRGILEVLADPEWDPNDIAADGGVTTLDVVRKDAKTALGGA